MRELDPPKKEKKVSRIMQSRVAFEAIAKSRQIYNESGEVIKPSIAENLANYSKTRR